MEELNPKRLPEPHEYSKTSREVARVAEAQSRALGRMSVVSDRLTSSPEGPPEPERLALLGTEPVERGEAKEQMPIMLATSGEGPGIERVIAMLNQQGIAYNVTYVDSYTEPRLQVGSSELVGEDEISEHLAEIRILAGV
ncbi:hypothetical protein HQQ81_19495 [Microbacteriaceae bacterium VKM Ac-2854]|nr:hypothetical protein [Microbacteriaceae bacterium VKM Ac-2854]